MAAKVRLDHAGIAQVLKSAEMKAAVHEVATKIADGVDAPDVVVDDYTTDRAASSVTIAHPSGMARQAKHGVLTRAAAAAGYEVHERGAS